ncbi:MAG: hypothetical protein V3T00_08335 [bacterium]
MRVFFLFLRKWAPDRTMEVKRAEIERELRPVAGLAAVPGDSASQGLENRAGFWQGGSGSTEASPSSGSPRIWMGRRL